MNFPADKGKYGGSCNRSACLAPNATWWNHGSNAYYCKGCGNLINQHNRDASFWPLCTPPPVELGDIVWERARQAGQVRPLDIFEGEGDFTTTSPTFVHGEGKVTGHGPAPGCVRVSWGGFAPVDVEQTLLIKKQDALPQRIRWFGPAKDEDTRDPAFQTVMPRRHGLRCAGCIHGFHEGDEGRSLYAGAIPENLASGFVSGRQVWHLACILKATSPPRAP